MPSRLPLLLLLLPMAAAPACSATGSTVPARFSGFLSSYDGLEEDAERPGSFRTVPAGASLARYSKVFLAPIEIWPDPDADYGGLNITDARRVADDFVLEFNRALGMDYPMTTRAGPDVLYLRIAITDLRPSNSLRTWKRMWAGSGSSTQGAHAQFENPHLSIDAMTIEAEGLDGETGERLFALVEGRKTGRGRDDQSQTWDSVRNDLAAWAQRLRAALDRTHGR